MNKMKAKKEKTGPKIGILEPVEKGKREQIDDSSAGGGDGPIVGYGSLQLPCQSV